MLIVSIIQVTVFMAVMVLFVYGFYLRDKYRYKNKQRKFYDEFRDLDR